MKSRALFVIYTLLVHRWVKFEEDVEIGGNRWSKPHVGALTLHSLFELRSLFNDCILCMDMRANNLEDIAELALDRAVNEGHLSYDKKATVKAIILKRHRHQYQYEEEQKTIGILPMVRSLTEITKHKKEKGTATHTRTVVPSRLVFSICSAGFYLFIGHFTCLTCLL